MSQWVEQNNQIYERISCEIASNFTNNYKETASDIKLKVKFGKKKW